MEFFLNQVSAPLAPPVFGVGSEVALVGHFSNEFRGVVGFVDRAFADSAGEHEIILLNFLSAAGLAVGGGLLYNKLMRTSLIF